MLENSQKILEKSSKKRIKARVMGVLRFKALEFLKNSPLPVTVTQMLYELKKTEPSVQRQWMLGVIKEIDQVHGIERISRRSGKTKCYAYYMSHKYKQYK